VDRLGVVTRDVSVHIARTIQLPNGATGALVLSVTKGSAAERGGIQPGDVIVRFAGARVGRVSDLNDIVAKAQAGEALVMLVRVGYFRSVKVTLQ
jgi:serine protease Do